MKPNLGKTTSVWVLASILAVLLVHWFTVALRSRQEMPTLALKSKASIYSRFGSSWYETVLASRNLSSAWASRFWLMEERQYVPLLFDTTLFSNFSGKEFSNLAIAAIPSNDEPNRQNDTTFLVAVRSHYAFEKRWGTLCAIGALDSQLFISLAAQQPAIDLQFPKEPVDFIDSSYTNVQNHSQLQLDVLPSTHDSYHLLLEEVRRSGKLYGKYEHSDIWVRPFRGVSVRILKYADVRIYYRMQSSTRQICLLGQIAGWKGSDWEGIGLGMHVACYDESDLLGEEPVAPFKLLARIPNRYNHRNLVPLIERSGMHYQNEFRNLTWFMDTMGGENKQPLVFPISLESGELQQVLESNGPFIVPYAQENTNLEFSLKGCEYLTDWRGNSPVVRFTDRLWITVVHKFGISEKVAMNPLGRTYRNKLVLFEADSSGELPTQCLQMGPEATDTDVFQRRPHLQFEWPFAFILGLIHLGKVHNYAEGESHRFILSAGLDDFKPAFKIIDIFVPHI
jgi:hypothetical protein